MVNDNFLMGGILKVAILQQEVFFSEDDDDFETNFIIDRNLAVSANDKWFRYSFKRNNCKIRAEIGERIRIFYRLCRLIVD